MSRQNEFSDEESHALGSDELHARLEVLSNARLARWRKLALALWKVALAVIAIAFLVVPVSALEVGEALAVAMLVVLATVVLGSILGLISVTQGLTEARREARLFMKKNGSTG